MLQELVDKYGFEQSFSGRNIVSRYFTEANIHVSVCTSVQGYIVKIYHDGNYKYEATSVEGVIKRIVEFCNFIIERNNIENKSFEALRSLFEQYDPLAQLDRAGDF